MHHGQVSRSGLHALDPRGVVLVVLEVHLKVGVVLNDGVAFADLAYQLVAGVVFGVEPFGGQWAFGAAEVCRVNVPVIVHLGLEPEFVFAFGVGLVAVEAPFHRLKQLHWTCRNGILGQVGSSEGEWYGLREDALFVVTRHVAELARELEARRVVEGDVAFEYRLVFEVEELGVVVHGIFVGDVLALLVGTQGVYP